MRNETSLKHRYFDWLLSKVGYRRTYSELYKYLNEIPFEAVMLEDENRAADGYDLRYRFAYENNIDYREIACLLDNEPCSMLELIIALAIRMEESFMSDSYYGDRTQEWVHRMICSLGLSECSNESFDPNRVDKAIGVFMERKYFPDGYGGLFTIPNCNRDLTQVEIYNQMCWYCNYLLDE